MTTASLTQTLLPYSGRASLYRDLLIGLVGSIALAVSAQAKIPVGPVPITLQTFVLFTMAMAFGWRAAGIMVLAYWAEGLAGLPVFAGAPHASAAVFAGPTGGFLFGFLPAAVLTGWLAEKGWDRNKFTALAAMMLGTLLLYALGTPWFALFATSISQAGEVTRNGLGWSSTWQYAVQPFLIGDVVKMLAAALIFPELWRRVKR